MYTSRVSSKGQLTLPKKIRDIMGIKAGDQVLYDVDDGVVKLKRVEAFDGAFHSALTKTLDEWTTPEDENSFSDL